ncbi:MAG: DNA mismatch endonuclease Vsr, partial [Candidatus Competibacteraceae bacterium]|nr:DNA mismatch endonuclease Vsr [Candidatus Competibacteraceae bacterium]
GFSRTLTSMLHHAGFRFRLHDPKLPGRPDIILPKYQTVIFVHGCFWHRHPGCKNATTPSSNTEFWKDKFEATIARDSRNVVAIKKAGWNVITVWECELESSPESVLASVSNNLKGGR